jgi:response regulator RpfG family c-di-GMP phosphodiesterase
VPERVLFVDDDANLLASLQRQFRGVFDTEVAPDGAAGLDVLAARGPFAVVVSDYRMPGLTGTEFLTKVAERSPDTVRILLTGYAELQTAIDAVNRGQVFRFLTKPCPHDILRGAVQAGLDQYALVHAQKDLLENTLRGSVKVFADMLGIANPRAFGKAGRLRKIVAALAETMALPNAWQLDIAAMLAFVGCVSVPEAVWAKLEHGERLTLDEEVMINKHPRVGYELLAGIPRLGDVAEAVRYQDRRFDGWDDTGLTFSGTAIPIGARLLKVASDYDAAVQRGLGPGAAFLELEAHPNYYDPTVLAALKQVVGRSGPGVLMRVPLTGLRPGMTLKDGLFNRHGVRMMAAQEVTPALLSRIRNMTLREPIPVWVPPTLVEEIASACDVGVEKEEAVLV